MEHRIYSVGIPHFSGGGSNNYISQLVFHTCAQFSLFIEQNKQNEPDVKRILAVAAVDC